MNRWQFIHRVKSGHKFFKELDGCGQPTGKIGIADDSGINPDRCEDGCVYLDLTRPIHVGWIKEIDSSGAVGYRDSIYIPTVKKSGEEMHMGGSWHEVLDLAHRYNMRIETESAGTFRITQMVEAGLPPCGHQGGAGLCPLCGGAEKAA